MEAKIRETEDEGERPRNRRSLAFLCQKLSLRLVVCPHTCIKGFQVFSRGASGTIVRVNMEGLRVRDVMTAGVTTLL